MSFITQFITFIFYLSGLLFIILEIGSAQEAKKVLTYRERLRQDIKSKSTTIQKLYSFFQFLYMIWTFIGLFSSQWLLFILIILMSVGTSILKIKSIFLQRLDCWICASIMIFIIVNRYHFHLDLFHLIF